MGNDYLALAIIFAFKPNLLDVVVDIGLMYFSEGWKMASKNLKILKSPKFTFLGCYIFC